MLTNIGKKIDKIILPVWIMGLITTTFITLAIIWKGENRLLGIFVLIVGAWATYVVVVILEALGEILDRLEKKDEL